MPSSTATVGLRVDVDTFRGTRDGVPQLLATLRRRGIRATFFFTVGPDNMGRHLWKLIKPAFLIKMLRTNAPGLYGWDILLRGTLWPGPRIGERLSQVIVDTVSAGHEVGLHAWDHHRWQIRARTMGCEEAAAELCPGFDTLNGILEPLGSTVSCSAAAGWQCSAEVLRAKEKYPMTYNSDCRGDSIFVPMLGDAPATPQIPTTLPTYDEVIGSDGVTDETYNAYLLSLVRPDRLNVLTIHAEVEGIARTGLFEDFLNQSDQRGIGFVPLGDLLTTSQDLPRGSVTSGSVPGRYGSLCVQAQGQHRGAP